MSVRPSDVGRLSGRRVARIGEAESDVQLASRLGALSSRRVSVWFEQLLDGEVSVAPVIAFRSAQLLAGALRVRPVAGVERVRPFLEVSEGRGLAAAALHLSWCEPLLSDVVADPLFPPDAFAGVRVDRLVPVTAHRHDAKVNVFINRQVEARLLAFLPLDHVVVRHVGAANRSPLGLVIDQYCESVFDLDRTHRAMLGVMVASGVEVGDVGAVAAAVVKATAGWSRAQRMELLSDVGGAARWLSEHVVV